MGLMNEIGSLLQQYQGASASAPPGNVEQDFRQVAPRVPPSAIAGGLSEAFRSSETPAFGQMVSQMFAQSNGEQRAGILNHLIGAAGPSVASSAVFAGLSSLLQGRPSVTPEQAGQVSPETVQNLAEHASARDPSIVDQASQFYAQHPTLVQGLGAGALALIMSHMSRR
jgi:hypothetical protein